MKLLITGICGFVGSSIAVSLRDQIARLEVFGIDNLWRPGSEVNRARLRAAGITVHHGDIRLASDMEAVPVADWVIDAAANASVLAGVDGGTSPRQLLEHNLFGTGNVLEYCRHHGAGLILLSTSRVYRLSDLCSIPLREHQNAFTVAEDIPSLGVTQAGINESFPAGAPASLYGSTKFASELLALEYSDAFEFPVWINRCGVLSGAGQFGQPAQGIFAWWIHRWVRRRPLRYLGFGGRGLQVRDCLHPEDLANLIAHQIRDAGAPGERRTFNVSGGIPSATSLAQLSAWCTQRLGSHEVVADGAERPFDVPWLVLDSGIAATRWGWRPRRGMPAILEELAVHAEEHPDWLDLSEG